MEEAFCCRWCCVENCYWCLQNDTSDINTHGAVFLGSGLCRCQDAGPTPASEALAVNTLAIGGAGGPISRLCSCHHAAAVSVHSPRHRQQQPRRQHDCHDNDIDVSLSKSGALRWVSNPCSLHQPAWQRRPKVAGEPGLPVLPKPLTLTPAASADDHQHHRLEPQRW